MQVKKIVSQLTVLIPTAQFIHLIKQQHITITDCFSVPYYLFIVSMRHLVMFCT